MLGANSVEYHRETVMSRGDDFAGQALAYYASRGETPLVWGGSGVPELGLDGTVSDRQYSAIFGPGGARDWRQRPDDPNNVPLVATTRPGVELVVAAHKSVAELGVIGQAEHMHAILDAERDATLAYLDGMVRTQGGRRGRARVATPTGGLIYAHTRHATSRAGDPSPHDHVLVANLVRMADERGGWKALDTVAVRDHLHAATIVGRLAGAAKAVELGYAIVPDQGQSGRLGHWAIAGIPREVQELHSTRSADIADYLDRTGKAGWRARGIAARETRPHKHHTPVGELLPRWREELASIGWPAERLFASVEAASAERTRPRPLLSRELDAVVAKALDPDGELARAKVFHRRDVVVAVGPLLFGRPAGELRRTVDAVMASAQTIALLPTAGARERVWSLASVLATETAIAETVARGAATTDVAVVATPAVEDAIEAAEERLGRALTDGQREAVFGICQNGERVSLVEGVAGAGKTTALRCVADAYRAAGFAVLGTATSGQAARTLRTEAGIDSSRTIASLRWALDHRRLALSARHVVILDEVGMTTDPDLLRVATACEAAGAKLVLVGDDRQLGAVGPGGGLGALLERHGGLAHVLDENVRQRDPNERAALAELRAGSIERAVEHYASSGRLHVSPHLDAALSQMVDAWATDALAGKDAAMYAWQRRNVETLNRLARECWRAEGRLSGPELVAPGGRAYAVGDRVVTLRPGNETVTSERGEVVRVDLERRELTARIDDGRLVRLLAEETSGDRLAHGYAVTVHRAQGATVDAAHRLEDGGGRELAYVAMSRPREHGHVWVVADDLEQAKEDLVREWSRESRPRWAIDTTMPLAAYPVAAGPLIASSSGLARRAGVSEVVVPRSRWLARARERVREIPESRGLTR